MQNKDINYVARIYHS